MVILRLIVCCRRTPRLGQGHPPSTCAPQGSGRRVWSWDPGALQRGERCGPGTARAPESQGSQGPTLLSLPVPMWS